VWRSLLLHEIPSGDLRNFSAVDGAATSFPWNADAIGPGEEFEFTLGTPVSNVIGISLHIRLRKPIAEFDECRIARAGTDVEFSIQRLNTGVIDVPELAAEYRGLLRIGPSPADSFGLLTLPHRTYVDIRIDWHTSGQARLLQGGELIGYHNAVSPGASVSVPTLAFGRSDRPPGPGSRYGVQRFFVRALQRTDALAALSRLFPDIPAKDDPMVARCRVLALNELLSVVDSLRPFMSLFHQQTSSPWSPDTTGPPDPFSEASEAAHRSALAAGAALVRMLRTMDFEAPQAFLEPFEDLLRTLHDALPGEFEALAQNILSSQGQLPDECRQLLEDDRLARGSSMDPILELFQDAATIVRQVAGL
jgi:hypothetical protein